MPPFSPTFDGLQDFPDAHMPLRIFLTGVLEQCGVFEDVIAFLSRVPARRGGTALPGRQGTVSGLWDLQGLLLARDAEF